LNTVEPTRALSKDIESRLFQPDRELLPNVDDIYELQLAYYENRILSEENLIRNGAYFSKVAQKYTRHFLMCTGKPLKLPHHSSSRLKSFFEKNIFRTGYATHGLFPYRGKFHPQMIKGLMNAMGLKPSVARSSCRFSLSFPYYPPKLQTKNLQTIVCLPFCAFSHNTRE